MRDAAAGHPEQLERLVQQSIAMEYMPRGRLLGGIALAACQPVAAGSPQPPPPPPSVRFEHDMPHDAPTIEARMTRHLWATDRLWEGVVGGDHESWQAGLAILAASPAPEMQTTPERAKLAWRMQQLADSARRGNRTDAPPDRATSYGEILVTCASCHASTK